MGEPKATGRARRPAADRLRASSRIVGSAGLEPVVVAKPDSPLPTLDCRVAQRAAPSRATRSPGIVAALERAAPGAAVVAIACDMPLVPATLLAWLAQLEEPVAVCEVGGRLEPLLGRYSPRGRPSARRGARATARRCARRSPRSTRSSSPRPSSRASATPSGSSSTSTRPRTWPRPSGCSTGRALRRSARTALATGSTLTRAL